MEQNKIYIVYTNLESGVIEQEIFKISDSYYWVSKTDRRSLFSRYYIVYYDRQKAIDGLKGLIKNKIQSMESNMKYYQEKLEKITKQYENEN